MNKNFLIPALLLLASGGLLFVGQSADVQTRAEFEQQLNDANDRRVRELTQFYEIQTKNVRRLGRQPLIAEALRDFSGAIEEISREFSAEREELNAFIEQTWLPYITDIKQVSDTKRIDFEDEEEEEEEAIAQMEAGEAVKASALTNVPSSHVAVKLKNRYNARNPNPFGSKELMLGATEAVTGDPWMDKYDEAHQTYHPAITDFSDENNLFDIYLITPGGRVVYSVEKEMDFASNLLSGPDQFYQLALAYKRTLELKTGEVFISKLKPYVISGNIPAQFMANPLFALNLNTSFS